MRVITLLMLVLGAMLWLEPETIKLRGEDALPIRHESAALTPTLGVSGGVCMTSMPMPTSSTSTAVMVPCTSNTATVVWTQH